MSHLDKIYAEQEIRQSKFPKNRIAFMRSTATEDTVVLGRYANREISFDQLCELIAYNNRLERYFEDGKIPAEMMKNELKEIGWRLV